MELNINNLMCARPFERVGRFSLHLQGYFIGTTFRAYCLGDLDLIFKAMVGLTTTSCSKIITCMHSISGIFAWIPTKLAQIHD